MRLDLSVASLVVCLLTTAPGCKKEPASSKPTSPVASAPAPMPAASQPAAPAGTLTEGGLLTGKLLERIDAATYSYLRIATATGEVWAAVPQTTLAVGADVTVTDVMLNQNFESKTLKRSFPEIYFGNLAGAGAAAPGMAAPAPAPGAANPHMSAPPTATAKVPRAEGADGRTITELFAQKAKLVDKSVSVRGTVVKFTGGVMGKNWLHLRDGSGTEASKDHDVTVTTQDNAAIGEVVLIKGTVHLDKDFGAGYLYPLIIEDATVTR